MYESDQITFFVKFVSGNLHTQGVWEPQITALLQKALRQDTTSTLVDVGAHVGYYSLLAAAMGHKVISIEPNVSIPKQYPNCMSSKIMFLH